MIKLKVAVDIKNLFNKKRKRFWAGILLAQFLLFYFFSKVEYVIDLFGKFFEFQKAFHQQLFSRIPFSVGDAFYIALGILLLFYIIKTLKKNRQSVYFTKLLILLNLFYFIYQVFWGMLYFQKPILDQLPKGKITLEETETLAINYLLLCNETRRLVKEDANGVFIITDLPKIKREILDQQNNLPSFIRSKKATNIDAFKPSLFKGVMSYSGILGYYNPFSAEAQYNSELPPTSLPFTLAHESMHQLGFAREQEANFTGYLVGKNSSNLELRYSTQIFVLRSLLNSLAEKNPEFVQQILRNYSEEMQRDRLAEKEFRKNHEGFLDVAFGFTNDLFLKSNQQEGSVTYSYFIDLLLRYERTLK